MTIRKAISPANHEIVTFAVYLLGGNMRGVAAKFDEQVFRAALASRVTRTSGLRDALQ